MKKIVLLLCIFTLCSGYSLAQTENVRQSMIVFDSSGSMWGQVEGTAKISIAKDVLKNIISEWDPSIHVGLIAYGHRKKGDCHDIETLAPISVVDKKSFISKIENISPKGKTPISSSLLMAAKELRYTEEKATVILISDGKETCAANPCETAEELEKFGVDFITHVIGFDVDQQTEAQLKCIADTTGGKYFTAKNAEALNEAMSTIVEEVKVVSKDNLKVTASETTDGEFVRANHVLYTVENGQKADKKGSQTSTVKQAAAFGPLPVGEYLIVSKYSGFEQETKVEIKVDETSTLNVVMGQTGNVSISASETEDGDFIRANHTLYIMINGKKADRKAGRYSTKEGAYTFTELPVGKYLIISQYSGFEQETKFEIKAQETSTLHVVMGQTGNVSISASEIEGGGFIRADHTLYTMKNGKKADRKAGRYSTKGGAYTFTDLPVGNYLIISQYSDYEQEMKFEIKAGETSALHAVMGQTGNISISASETEGGAFVRANHTLYTMENGKKADRKSARYSTTKGPYTFTDLPVGGYLIISNYNGQEKETTLTVNPGEKVTSFNVKF